jgi:hypothetical protein
MAPHTVLKHRDFHGEHFFARYASRADVTGFRVLAR